MITNLQLVGCVCVGGGGWGDDLAVKNKTRKSIIYPLIDRLIRFIVALLVLAKLLDKLFQQRMLLKQDFAIK